ncbi:allantoinase [Escherichia coli]|nr:allantoinase [Escherichia coli]
MPTSSSFSRIAAMFITNDDLEYRHKVSPYVGRTIGARITKTILRGDVIYDIEQGFPVAPKGQFILKHQQ